MTHHPGESPSLKVIIKGNRHVAHRSASERDIPFVFDRDYRCWSGWETIGHVPSAFLDAVSKWFMESKPIIPGKGYPHGTCLLYQVTPMNREQRVAAIIEGLAPMQLSDPLSISRAIEYGTASPFAHGSNIIDGAGHL